MFNLNLKQIKTNRYVLAVAVIWYAAGMLGLCCGEFTCSNKNWFAKPKCVGFNWLFRNGAILAFICQYYIVIDALDSISDKSDSCGAIYESVFNQSETYYDDLTSWPAGFVLAFYICESVAFCGLLCIASKVLNDGDNNNKQNGIYQPLARGNSTRARGESGLRMLFSNLTGGVGTLGGAGRDRTDSEQRVINLVGAIVFTAYGFEFVKLLCCHCNFVFFLRTFPILLFFDLFFVCFFCCALCTRESNPGVVCDLFYVWFVCV